jgi:hypothetical protein
MAKKKISQILESLGPPKLDRVNFEIPKVARFSNRFLQIALAALTVFFLSRNKDGITAAEMLESISTGVILACVSMGVSALGMLLYTQFIFNNWTSRKVILLETVLDIGGGTSVFVAFINMSTKSGMGSDNAICKPFQAGSPAGCNLFHWGFAFLVLTFLTWVASVCIDFRDIFFGMMASQKLQDDVELAGLENTIRKKMRKESLSVARGGPASKKSFGKKFKSALRK